MQLDWTEPEDVRAQVEKLWNRGDLLRHVIDGNPSFPRRLRLKKPSSPEIAGRFEEVRNWIARLRKVSAVRIEWREVAHRVHGANTLPDALWLDRPEDAFGLIGKHHEVNRFRQLSAWVRARQPKLLPWLARRSLQALALFGEFERLLDIVDWLRAHPRPGIYLRQVDLPGVHSKFIEAHRGVLAEWLDLVLPAEAVDTRHTGVAHFGARYGFRDKPAHIRFRPLDPAMALLPGPRLPDLSLDADNFAALDISVQRVFITENETNYLAFPPFAGSLVIFGSGYGWEALARARRLADCPIHYWGDIDTHGFAILDRLRSHFPHVRSLLMDRATLLAHEAFWGRESAPLREDLRRLTETERALYEDLRDNRLRPGLRLEQERIGFGFVEAALRGVQ